MRSWLFIFLMWLSFFAGAQKSSPTYFHHLDKDRGLRSNFLINDILRDSEGFVWIGSFAGLNRFDGFTVKQYYADPKDSTALFGNTINKGIFEDSGGNLWLTTPNAIHCYQREEDNFKRYYIKNDTGDTLRKYLKTIYLERDSFLWIIGGDSTNNLYRFDIHSKTNLPKIAETVMDIEIFVGLNEKDSSMRYIYSIDGHKSPGLELFEVNENGRLVNQSFFFRDSSEELPQLNIHAIHEADLNSIWIATERGLYKWYLGTYRLEKVTSSSDKIYDICPFDDDHILLNFTNDGIKKLNINDYSLVQFPIHLSEVPAKKTIRAVRHPYIDNRGIMWMNYYQNGVIYADLNKSKFELKHKLPLSDGSTTYRYRAFQQDYSGDIWFSSYPKGIIKTDENGKVKFIIDKLGSSFNLPSKQIFDILLNNNHLLIGTESGSAYLNLNTNKFKMIYSQNGDSITYVVNFLDLDNGQILASSFQKGIYALEEYSDNYKLRIIPEYIDDSMAKGFQDHNKREYFSVGYNHIEVYQKENGVRKLKTTLPISGGVNSYLEDQSNQTLWVGSTDGLFSVDLSDLKKAPQRIGLNQALGDYQIQSMLRDELGHLWLGTNNGLIRYTISDSSFHQFSKSDGALSSEYNEQAAFTHQNGQLWFGGNNGITIVEPDKIEFLQDPPKIHITGIKINDEEPDHLACQLTGATNVTQIKKLVNEYANNTLSFDFVAIDYSDPKATQLQYKLEGKDKHWVHLPKGQLGFARYSGLREGDYKLLIKGANSDGVWGEAVEKLQITILPPLHRKPWFQVLVILGLLGMGYGFYRYRIAQIRERADFKARIAENKMAALRAQMNPHFVFNSLQTLNGLIARKELRGAIDYVGQFAKLMRMILENSRVGKVAIEKEIELLELYMQVEARRFKMPFTYEINVGNNVDTFGMEIPAMLLQPFVENSIKHGLFHKEGKGHIKVSFSKDNGFLSCVVEDNGVGRAKSAEFNAQQGRQHQSRGMQIIDERLQIINRGESKVHEVTIEDIKDENDNPVGTRVEIQLPIK